ncbi:hypothetical protein DSL64_04035 [Dyadobacter luteus]|jgi:hypothetical protein|uniref:Uncharacterized protein n=1 Tax=Dyadobacter luteus TaxID=2259619 RepID=A0A3D8YGU1_9BACT|nr:hypothetical protein DSL64_04035 [Dyadobacter luteus]
MKVAGLTGKLPCYTMTTPVEFENAQILRTALTCYLISALQSTVCGNDIINSTGASFEFKIDGLANSLECHFTHRQIAKVYADDKEFDTICLRIIEELCKQYPDLKTHTVCRTFTMKR